MSRATRAYQRKMTVLRTINALKKQIARLDEMRDQYLNKAKEAKLKGNVASYNVARSGLKAAIIQHKNAEVMLLNIEIAVQYKDFASLTGSFVRGIGIAGKELDKEVGKMNFKKASKLFSKGFASLGSADEGLKSLMEQTEATYAAATDDAKLDAEIDGLIGVEVAFEEDQFDRRLEDLRNGTPAKPKNAVAVGAASPVSVDDKGFFSKTAPAKPTEYAPDSTQNAKLDAAPETGKLSGAALRPLSWQDFQGQPLLKKQLQESISAAKIRGEPLKHILLYGPPGLGKTTLAKIVAEETGARLFEVHGLNLKNVSDVATQLERLREGDILFIDEIHCVSPKAQEAMYTALEDFRFTYPDKDNKLVTKTLPRFTLIGATTHAGRLNKPLLDRIGNQYVLQRYPKEEIQRIIFNFLTNMGFGISASSAMILAERCRGVPRIARGHCEKLSDKALNRSSRFISENILNEYLTDNNLDSLGLTNTDIRLLESLIKLYGGGPAGITTLANCIGVNEEEIREKIEPYLNYIGLLNTVSGGRVATDKAYAHLGHKREGAVVGSEDAEPSGGDEAGDGDGE